MRRAWLITACLLACKKEAAERPAPPLPQATPIDASIADAPPPIDAVPPPDALHTAEWPTAIESEIVEDQRTVGEYDFALSYPKFRTRPPAIGQALAALLAPHLDPGLDPKQHQGRLDFSCERRVVNRLVAILECSHMHDHRTLAEARAGTGGAPAGPDRFAIAVWLQPGLPKIAVRDLAPGVDVAALLVASATCRDSCVYVEDSFVIDGDGAIRFIPRSNEGYCPLICDQDDAPRIELDALRPTHPWAKKLDAWIRQRLAAGESLVK